MHILRKGIDMSSWVYYICKLKGSHLEHRQYCLCKQFHVTLDLIIYSYVYVKHKKMEHPDTKVLIFISFHSSVFAVFVWLVVMFAGIPIQFNLCVLMFYMRSQNTFSGKLTFKLKHGNYWYRFASVQRTKPQLIPPPSPLQ